MPKSLPDIIYDKSNITPIVDSQNSFYTLPYYKDTAYFTKPEKSIIDARQNETSRS